MQKLNQPNHKSQPELRASGSVPPCILSSFPVLAIRWHHGSTGHPGLGIWEGSFSTLPLPLLPQSVPYYLDSVPSPQPLSGGSHRSLGMSAAALPSQAASSCSLPTCAGHANCLALRTQHQCVLRAMEEVSRAQQSHPVALS